MKLLRDTGIVIVLLTLGSPLAASDHQWESGTWIAVHATSAIFTSGTEGYGLYSQPLPNGEDVTIDTATEQIVAHNYGRTKDFVVNGAIDVAVEKRSVFIRDAEKRITKLILVSVGSLPAK